MTQREIIYDIKEKLKFSSDDIDIVDEYIAYLINVKRSFIIKQRFSKFTRNISQEIRQNICIDLEDVDVLDGNKCFGKVLRSKQKLPNFIELGGRSAIITIRTEDRTYPHFNPIPIERLPYVGYNKYLQKQLYVALDADQKLYFKSDNPQHLLLNKVMITGVFENPELADELDCISSTDCDFYDKTYPIELYIVNDVVNLIVRELSTGLNLPDDKLNNADETNRT